MCTIIPETEDSTNMEALRKQKRTTENRVRIGVLMNVTIPVITINVNGSNPLGKGGTFLIR